jgi:hypothetical protein
MAGIMPALEAHDDVGPLASQSTILPLPSSPHWAPMTVTLAIKLPLLLCRLAEHVSASTDRTMSCRVVDPETSSG